MEKIYMVVALISSLITYWVWRDKLKLMDELIFLKKEIIRERNTTREDEVIEECLSFLNRLFGDQLKYEVELEENCVAIRIYKIEDDRNNGIMIESFSFNQFPYSEVIELVLKDKFYLKGIKLFPEKISV